jgi:glycosyltransferase involved in cell wall biosynthesis
VSGVALTIVVPVFDEGRRLPVSLPALAQSVQAAQQQLGLIEVVVIDDGSSDDTAGIAQSYCDLFSAAQLVRLPWNCGKVSQFAPAWLTRTSSWVNRFT